MAEVLERPENGSRGADIWKAGAIRPGRTSRGGSATTPNHEVGERTIHTAAEGKTASAIASPAFPLHFPAFPRIFSPHFPHFPALTPRIAGALSSAEMLLDRSEKKRMRLRDEDRD